MILYSFQTQDHDPVGKTTDRATAMAYKQAHQDYIMEESTTDSAVNDLPVQTQ